MRWLTLFLAAYLSSGVMAHGSEIPIGEESGCREGPLAQFGQYLGDWDIRDEQLAPDGSEWLPGKGARWIFVCIGNGTGIQDFWLAPDGNVGTNLRTFNPGTGVWDIAWAINTQPGFAHIEARQQDNGTIVMRYLSPVPEPLRRITFYPPDKNGWRWTLEYSRDDGEKWREVYRIQATCRLN